MNPVYFIACFSQEVSNERHLRGRGAGGAPEGVGGPEFRDGVFGHTGLLLGHSPELLHALCTHQIAGT